MIFRQTKSTQA